MNIVVFTPTRTELRLTVPIIYLLIFCIASACAEDLTLTNGTVYKNITVTKVDPDGLRIIHSDGGGKVLFTDLPAAIQTKYHYDPIAAKKYTTEQAAKQKANLDRALQQSAATAAAAAKEPAKTAPTSTSSTAPQPTATRRTPNTILPMIKGDLVYLNGERLSRFNDSKLTGIRYYAIYYSASWCGPCRQFSPELVHFYNEFKPSHPNFEVILVSMDTEEKHLLDYMKSEKMPWPAVELSTVGYRPQDPLHGPGIRTFAKQGIPNLVLVDATTGNMLSDSFEGEEYVGPYKVLVDIKKMVPAE